MKLLVTGGCGFIGTNFIRKCLSEYLAGGDLLVNLDKLTYAGNEENLNDFRNDPRYRFTQGDIGDTGLVEDLLSEHSIDSVVNFAAETHVDRSIDSPEPFFAVNVTGTLRLADSLRRFWKSLPPTEADRFRLLHVSTDEVYGSLGPEEHPFTEQTPIAPNSPYAASKAAGDLILRSYHQTYGLPVVMTRCSNNYGPWQFPEKLIPLMILNALEGKPLPIYGDGQNVRDWLHVEDHCDALWQVLGLGTLGEVYNIGGDAEKTNLEVVDWLGQILDELKSWQTGLSYKTLKSFVADRPGHDRRYAMDYGKLKDELGWSPQYDFADGMTATVKWYLENLDWCEIIHKKKYRRERLGLSGS